MQRPHGGTARHLRALGLAVLVPLLAGLLTACGGSGSPSASAAAKEQSNETKLADYARCMREHGFDAEVANVPGGGRGLKIRPGSALGPADSEAAEKACARYRPEPKPVNLSPQQKVEREEAVQKFAKCMREHGIKVEASVTGGAIRVLLHGHPGSGPNPEAQRSSARRAPARSCFLPRASSGRLRISLTTMRILARYRAILSSSRFDRAVAPTHVGSTREEPASHARTSPLQPRVRALGRAALVPLMATLLAACGGSGSPSASSAAAKGHASEQNAETEFADYARCLREHGVNAEAQRRPGGGHGLKVRPGAAGGTAGIEAAERACARYRPKEPKRTSPSPQQTVEIEEGERRFAKCMREHGIEVEASRSGGIIIHAAPGGDAPTPESPAFQRAQGACQKLLPGGGP